MEAPSRTKSVLEAVFSTFDGDADGFISAQELEESLRLLGMSVSPAEAAATLESVDSNGDGVIDLDEFRELYDSMMNGGLSAAKRDDDDGEAEEEEQSLVAAFGVFDKDRDGLVTAEELRQVLGALGMAQRVEECAEMIARVDMDGDGKINFREFKEMMVVGKPLF